MSSFQLPDGTQVFVDGPMDVSLPVVVLLHGWGGSIKDMIDPANAWPGTAYNRAATFSFYKDEGVHVMPPFVPVTRFFLDPPATGLTSWKAALNAAGFTTITYSQPSGTTIGAVVNQLKALMTKLASMPDFTGRRFVLVAHSRGGLIARSFLVGARAAGLTGLLSRISTLITLHSPNAGSAWAGDAVTIDGLLAQLQTALAMAVGTAPAFLTALRNIVLTPDLAELAPGSATLTGIAAGEPVPGIIYHTFGGISTDFARLWAAVYTPDSTIPYFVPFVPIPFFHWASTPLVIGVALNAPSFIPVAAITLMPVVAEIVTASNILAATTPEFRPGFGDLLVSDARARLPFSTTHTTNRLNHAEALYDPTLQAQVIGILLGLRNPLVSGRAKAKINPYPVNGVAAQQYTVSATDSVTGISIPPGRVTVHDTFGNVALTAPEGTPFTYNFTPRIVHIFDLESGKSITEQVWPAVESQLDVPYGDVRVDIGR